MLSAQDNFITFSEILIAILCIEEWNPGMLSFFSKFPASESPQIPEWGAWGERYPLAVHFCISPNIYLIVFLPIKGAPFMFPNRVSSDRNTASPERLAERGDSIYFSFIRVCVLESPKGAFVHTYWRNIRPPFTLSHTDGRPRYNGVPLGSSKGIVNDTAICTPVPAAFGTVLSTLAWVDQSTVSQRVSSNRHQGIPSIVLQPPTKSRAE